MSVVNMFRDFAHQKTADSLVANAREQHLDSWKKAGQARLYYAADAAINAAVTPLAFAHASYGAAWAAFTWGKTTYILDEGLENLSERFNRVAKGICAIFSTQLAYHVRDRNILPHLVLLTVICVGGATVGPPDKITYNHDMGFTYSWHLAPRHV